MRSVPRMLVVDHHGPPLQCLQLGLRGGGIQNFVDTEAWVVGVVVAEHGGGSAGSQSFGHSRFQRRQFGGVIQLVGQHVEQQVEELVLHGLVPPGRKAVERPLHRLHLLATVLPRAKQRYEHVVPSTGNIRPAGGSFVVHGQSEPVGPEQVQAEVAEKLVAIGVQAIRCSLGDIGPGWCFDLEVPMDDGIEVVEIPNGGEVEIDENTGGKDRLVMTIEAEWFHGWFFSWVWARRAGASVGVSTADRV